MGDFQRRDKAGIKGTPVLLVEHNALTALNVAQRGLRARDREGRARGPQPPS
jgi:hypothetical protein